MTTIANILTSNDLQYIFQLPEIIAAKCKLDLIDSGKVYFTIELTDTIRATLSEKFGLDLSHISSIPMRWIKGDTAPHIDRGPKDFENTYLVYLNDSPGEFILENDSYPITQNTAYIFNEGLSHKTQNTGNTARLLLGPMNEFAEPVGITIAYYPTETDALNDTNSLGTSGSYTVGVGGPYGGYTSWRIASNSTGTSSQALIYPDGSVLNADGIYYLYPNIPCFLKGTPLLCKVDGVEKYVHIEDIRNGTLVKTSLNGYKKVVAIGKGNILNPGTDERIENRLYKCSKQNYPELTDDLYITGCHSILVDTLTDKQREETTRHLGQIFVTDRKYRLIACIDERAEPWNSEGTYEIWHIALENDDEKMNYGVYANGGLIVETCSIRFLKNKANMTLV